MILRFHSGLPWLIAMVTACMLTLPHAVAEVRRISIPNYKVNTGDTLLVPLELDQAAGLAAIRVQVNYSREVLTLQSVTAGPLGEKFEFIQGEDDGLVQLSFARADELASGGGRLAVLAFEANSGASVDLMSELALADVVLSDATGVIDLRQKDTLVIDSGQVVATADPDIDNAANGLPDWWEEQHGMSLFDDNASQDPEKDGLSNLLEYAFGGNPTAADANQRGPSMNVVESEGSNFLSITFYRRKSMPGHLLNVQESAELQNWDDLSIPTQMRGAAQDMGDGTERIEVMGTRAMTGPSAVSKGFLRVLVDSY
ncbi:MAG: cohesin domain-containing protein [Luteolibacter sp.]